MSGAGLADPRIEPGEVLVAESREQNPARRRRWNGRAVAAAAGCCYAVLALLAFWPVQPFSTTSVVNCGCYDVAEQSWFLAWTPYAILHALNPFFTTALNQPFGANLAANTTMPLLGILVSPITLTLGPTASFNVLIRLALCLSALSMYLVLRHYRARPSVAFLGGLLYGFSPYMFAQGSLHLNLCFVPLLPWIVVAVDDMVVRQAHSARRDGLTLGGLATAQYFISSELLADLGLVILIVLLLVGLCSPRRALDRLGRFTAGMAWALLPFAVLAGYPLVFSLVGPEHVAGSPFQPGYVNGYRNDLLSPLVPTSRQLLAPSGWAALGNTLVPNGAPAGLGAGGPGAENGAYLGIPLAACWIAVTAWAAFRRQGRVLVYAIAAFVAFVLSLGPRLDLHGHVTTTALPFWLFSSWPVIDFDVPARFSVVTDLALCLALAAGLEALLAWLGRRARPARRDVVVGLAPALLGVIALLPLLPSGPEVSAKVGLPGYFSSKAVRTIAPGAIVLAYPYPNTPSDQAMLWQIASGFRFRLIGGYVFNPFIACPNSDSSCGGGYSPPTLDPGTVPEYLFEIAYGGMPTVDPVPVAPWTVTQLRRFIIRYHVDDVVAAPLGADPGVVTSFLTAALHEQPHRQGGAEIWYDVQDSRLVRTSASHRSTQGRALAAKRAATRRRAAAAKRAAELRRAAAPSSTRATTAG